MFGGASTMRILVRKREDTVTSLDDAVFASCISRQPSVPKRIQILCNDVIADLERRGSVIFNF